MKEAHLHTARAPKCRQPGDGGTGFPIGGEIAAILIAVGVADHHFLDATLSLQHGAYSRQIEISPHHIDAGAQIVDGLEQWNDAHASAGLLTRREKSRLLHQQGSLQEIGYALRLRDHVIGDRAGSEALFQQGRLVGDIEFALGVFGVAPIRRAQQTRRRQFLEQQRYALVLLEAGVGRNHAGVAQQLVERAFVDLGVLAQIHDREMKAEGADRFAQIEQSAVSQIAIAVVAQRFHDHRQVGRESLGRGVGLGFPAWRPYGRASEQHLARGGQPRIDGGERAAIRLVHLLKRRVFRAGGQRLQRRAGRNILVADRQFGAQQVHLFEVIIENRLRLATDRIFQRLRGDVRIAVAVAAHPRAGFQERQDVAVQAEQVRQPALDYRLRKVREKTAMAFSISSLT